MAHNSGLDLDSVRIQTCDQQRLDSIRTSGAMTKPMWHKSYHHPCWVVLCYQYTPQMTPKHVTAIISLTTSAHLTRYESGCRFWTGDGVKSWRRCWIC